MRQAKRQGRREQTDTEDDRMVGSGRRTGGEEDEDIRPTSRQEE